MAANKLVKLHRLYNKHTWVPYKPVPHTPHLKLAKCACGMAALWLHGADRWDSLCSNDITLLLYYYDKDFIREFAKDIKYE